LALCATAAALKPFVNHTRPPSSHGFPKGKGYERQHNGKGRSGGSRGKEGAAAAATMAREVAAAAATGATATGYRVSLVPGGLEVSARLASNEELAILVKVLEANKGSLGKSSD
jgi:hypothetical protein